MQARPSVAALTPRRVRSDRHVELVVLATILAVGLVFARPDGQGWLRAVLAAAPILLNVIGMILIHRVDGYLNLAQIQVGLLAAAVFDGINRGQLLGKATASFCTDCLPGAGPDPSLRAANFVLAGVAALLTGVILSWAIRVTIMQRMAGSPVLMATVITVFVAQTLSWLTPTILRTLAAPPERSTAQATVQVPPGHVMAQVSLDVAGTQVGLWDAALVAAAVLALAAVTLTLRRGIAGVRLRAVAANRERAQTLGVDAGRISGRVWAVAGLLSAVAAISPAIARSGQPLGLPSNSDPGGAGTDVDVLVLVLAVVVFARFVSLFTAAACALALTLLAEMSRNAFGSTSALDAAMVLVVATVLMLRRVESTRQVRSDDSGVNTTREVRGIPRELRDLDQVRGPVQLAIIFAAVTLFGAPALMGQGGLSLLTDALVFALVALSVYVLTSWSGYVSFGQFGLAAVGAYTAAVIGWGFLPGLIVGAAVGAVTAVLVGWPAARLPGTYFAILTLTLAVSAAQLLLGPDLLGRFLPDTLPPADLFGLPVDDGRAYYYVTLLIVGGCFVAVLGLRRSRLGRVLIALRSNEAAARSFGIDPLRARMASMLVSGALAGLGGVLTAFHLGRVSATQFQPSRSLDVYLDTLIGGLGSLAGPAIGAGFYALLTFTSTTNAIVTFVAAGVGALLLLIAVPGGFVELFARARDATLRRLAYRLHIPVPSLMGDGGAAASQGRALLDEKRTPIRRPGSPALRRYAPQEESGIDLHRTAADSRSNR